MNKNPKNGNFERYEASSATCTQKKAVALFRDLTFEAEYKYVYNSANALKFIASAISAITMFAALYVVLGAFMNIYVAATIATAFCAVLEVLKTFMWTIAAKNLLKYRHLQGALACSLVAAHLISLAGSAYGAYKLPLQLTPENIQIGKISTDSVSRVYLTQISVLDAQFEDLKGELASGTVKRTMQNMAKQKGELVAAMQKELENAKLENQQAVENFKDVGRAHKTEQAKKIAEMQISCMLIACGFELMFVLCSLFIAYYFFRCYIDLVAAPVETPVAENAGENGARSKTASVFGATASVMSSRIGFVQQEQTNGKRLDYTKICSLNTCKEPFLHNVHNQKFCSKKCKMLSFLNKSS